MNVRLLKAKCVERGLSFSKLSDEINLSRSAFYRRMKNNQLTCKNVKDIRSRLDLTEDEVVSIFFGNNVA